MCSEDGPTFGSASNGVHKDSQQSEGSFKTSYIICAVLLCPLTLSLSILLGWHIYLMMHNKTTIKILLLGNIALGVHKDQQQSGGSFKTSYMIWAILLCPLTLSLSILLGWHIYLMVHNKTTIEYHDGVRAKWQTQNVGNMHRHPYDLGVYENLVSILLLGNIALGVHKDQQQSGGSFKTSYMIWAILLCPLTLSLSILLGWHIYLMVHNKTTIEV